MGQPPPWQLISVGAAAAWAFAFAQFAKLASVVEVRQSH